MEKYGYKNISSRNEFEKGSKINFGPVDTKHLSKYDFIDWSSQGNFGMPGQTRYDIKDVNALLGAQENASKLIIKERKPKGYVGW